MLLGLLSNDAIFKNRYVALHDKFSNMLKFIQNNVIFKTYEQIMFSCIIEYLAENSWTPFFIR